MKSAMLVPALVALLIVAPGISRGEPDVQPPEDLLSLALGAAYTNYTVEQYCTGDLTGDGFADYAFAAVDRDRPESAGAYFIYVKDRKHRLKVIRLANFKDGFDLQCLEPSRAAELDREIRENEVINGYIVTDPPATIVCVFVDRTETLCWRYDSETDAVVSVGGWTT